jgi:hypothetical protein
MTLSANEIGIAKFWKLTLCKMTFIKMMLCMNKTQLRVIMLNVNMQSAFRLNVIALTKL